MHSFVYGILGGILIGLSAALLVTLNGDVLVSYFIRLKLEDVHLTMAMNCSPT